MPKSGPAHPVTQDWKRDIGNLLRLLGWTHARLAQEVGVTRPAISHVLGKAGQSSLVPEIDKALARAVRRAMETDDGFRARLAASGAENAWREIEQTGGRIEPLQMRSIIADEVRDAHFGRMAKLSGIDLPLTNEDAVNFRERMLAIYGPIDQQELVAYFSQLKKPEHRAMAVERVRTLYVQEEREGIEHAPTPFDGVLFDEETNQRRLEAYYARKGIKVEFARPAKGPRPTSDDAKERKKRKS